MNDLVQEIATGSPITSYGETNFCRYCEVSWAEDSWAEYLKNAENPDAKNQAGWRVSHHDNDCLWVRANNLLATDG